VGDTEYTTVSGQDPQVSPDRPILPRVTGNATVAGQTAHDALITELTTSQSDVDPAIASANPGGDPVEEPGEFSTGSFPSSFARVSTYDSPDGTRQDVVLVPAQLESTTDPVTGAVTATQQLFEHTGVKVFYSNSNDHTRPTIATATLTRSGGTATFTVNASDDAGPVKRVLVLYRAGGSGAWTPLDLTSNGSGTWTGSASVSASSSLRWIAQAVDGAGNVAVSTNRGEIHEASAAAPTFDAGADETVAFGDRFTRSVAIDDTDSDRWTATLDLGAGPEPVEVRGHHAIIDTYPPSVGSKTATLQVCDDGGKCTSHTFTLDVTQNTAPVASVSLDDHTPGTAETLHATATTSDPEDDPVTRRFLWKVNGETVRDTGDTSATTDDLDLATPGVADVGDEVEVQALAFDGQVWSTPSSKSATVVSTAPTVDLPASGTASTASPYTANGTASDVDGSPLTAVADFGDGTDPVDVPVAGDGSFSLSHQYAAAGPFTVTVTATDPQGKTGSDTTPVTVSGSTPANDAPSVDAGANKTVAEGSPYTSSGTWSDPDNDTVTGTVDYGDGTATQALTMNGNGTFALGHTYRDNGSRTVTVTVDDGHGHTTSDTATVTVTSVAPVVTDVVGPAGPVTRNASTTVTSTFTDAGRDDTHTVSYAWGDGSTTTGTVNESNGSGSTSRAHTYTTAGTYAVRVTVRDDDGATTASRLEFVAVWDATWQAAGSGTFASPKGANRAAKSQTGTSRFAFIVRRASGRLYGSVDFEYLPGGLRFSGRTLSALSGLSTQGQATFRGTLNGASGYTLVLKGRDGDKLRPKRADTIRVIIRRTSNNALVYDSSPGTAAGATPTRTLSRGQVIIR
jgi:PKD repeat protein